MGITEDRRQRDGSWDAEAIRRLRRHAGLSQRELADQLNARQQTISEWERGAYAPRGTAARLLTRVAEDVRFPFESNPAASAEAEAGLELEPDDDHADDDHDDDDHGDDDHGDDDHDDDDRDDDSARSDGHG